MSLEVIWVPLLQSVGVFAAMGTLEGIAVLDRNDTVEGCDGPSAALAIKATNVVGVWKLQ